MVAEYRTVMITGGFGFIGTNLVKYWREKYPDDHILVVDAVTYAAMPETVREFGDIMEEVIDICDRAAVKNVIHKYQPDIILHLAAESHVCRSIIGPQAFMTTNIMGTFNLLEEWREFWDCDWDHPFIHVSTDEVFGELEPDDDPFTEGNPVAPRSPYAASKASSDLIALAYYQTYKLPVRVTNCSNNFGHGQHEEKLIPATVKRILEGHAPRIYGDGLQVRDWLHVDDHCAALDLIAHKGVNGERYCIGGDNEMRNIDLVAMIHVLMNNMAMLTHLDNAAFHVEHLPDARPTDDRRYAIDSSKLKALGWEGSHQRFKANLMATVQHYYIKFYQQRHRRVPSKREPAYEQ